ncbi:MAG TPA: glycoside hydrolase family 88 protein [Verrucomicrobiae bacterium]|nr:glycoside hydrolase family 88 protein [Verrucomicrobiae bacterium]
MRRVYILGFLVLFAGVAARAGAQSNDLSGWTDASIRTVISLVASNQMKGKTLADGNYTKVTTRSAAQSALKPTGITWTYPWGVALYGMLRVKDATGNVNFENFVVDHNLICARYYRWLNSLKTTVTDATPSQLATFYATTALSEFMAIDRLDYCGAMTAQLLEGARNHTGTMTNLQAFVAQTTANWIAGGGQARLPDGTLWRPERSDTIWADDLYMSCPFLVRWYQYTGNTNYLNDAATQVINMAGYLQDTNGIWYHGYYYDKHAVNGIKWCRANGWAMVTEAEVLSVMPTNHPAYAPVLDILRRHIAGIESVQDTDGMWHQVLDHPEVWKEVSSTAMFSYSIARAVNRGWIDPTNMVAARRGFAGLCHYITTNGVVNQVCPGTSLTNILSYYTTTEQPASNDPHGPGPVMLAGAEILLNPQTSIAATNNQVVVSWNAGLTNFVLETSTNLVDWSGSNDTYSANSLWQDVATNSGDQCDDKFYRLRFPPPPTPSPLSFEAESLPYVASGATASVSSDAIASGGSLVTLNGTGAGNYIEFTIPGVPAGAYRLLLGFKASKDRGPMNLTVDGNLFSTTLDQYWPTNFYPLVDFGTTNFPATGDHTVRLTVTGKSDASTNYTLSADKFLLLSP